MYYIRKYGKNQFSKIEKLIWNRLKRVSLWHREKEGIKGFGDIPQQAKIDWKSLMRKRGLSQFFVSAYALTVLAIQEKNSYNKKNIKKLEEIWEDKNA